MQSTELVHWIDSNRRTLHSNGAGYLRSLGHGISANMGLVTCRLCLHLKAREDGRVA